MKTINILLLFSLAMIISCEQEQPLPSNEISAEQMIPAGKTKKIKITSSTGILEYFQNANYCKQLRGGTLLKITGTGKASGLGNFEVLNTVCLDENNVPNSPFYGTLTTKNGSEIHTQLVFGPYQVEGSDDNYYDYVVLGGTGKFEKLQGGDITMYGIVDYQNRTFNLKGEGVLEY